MTSLLRRFLDAEPPERYPVRQRPDLSLEQQLEALREHVALMHDQLWWVSLPWWKRLAWRLMGFPAPIRRFYEAKH